MNVSYEKSLILWFELALSKPKYDEYPNVSSVSIYFIFPKGFYFP